MPHWNTLDIRAETKLFVVFTGFQNWNYFFCFKSAISEHTAPEWKAQAISTSDFYFPSRHLQANCKPLDRCLPRNYGTPLANTINTTAAALTHTAEVEVIPILFAIQPHSNNARSQWNAKNRWEFEVTQHLCTWECIGKMAKHNSAVPLKLFCFLKLIKSWLGGFPLPVFLSVSSSAYMAGVLEQVSAAPTGYPSFLAFASIT